MPRFGRIKGAHVKTIVCEKLEFASRAADHICAALEKKPDAVLALACGETMRPVWAELRRRCGDGELRFRDARILCATEFCDAPAEKSCRTRATRMKNCRRLS